MLSDASPASALAALAARAADQRPLPRGGIILAATPIGNILDASIRLIDALASADVIAAEDTRRARALAQQLGIPLRAQVLSNFDHNESDRAGQLVALAAQGQRVLVISDAGMPAVSDPGFPVVCAAAEAGVPITCLPGPSAVPTAVALSGVGVGHFRFLGFAPRKDAARRRFFADLIDAAGVHDGALCFFESPHRIADTLSVAAEVLGADRAAAVCRELTKSYEEVRRGTLRELAAWAGEGLRGEICVVIDGQPGAESAEGLSLDSEAGRARLIAEVEEAVAAGARLKAAAAEVAGRFGLSKKELYDAVIATRA